MKPEIVSVLAGCAVVASVVATMAAPVLNPKLGVIFPADQARSLLRQCSRAVPQGVQDVWTPDKKDIVTLERAFPSAVTLALDARGNGPDRDMVLRQLPHYARQYGGVTIAKRRYIYVNAFPTHLIDFDHSDATDTMYPQWRKRAAVVCDGGASLFGVLYEPARDQFSQFAFNGVA